ncbi:MAG: L-threonylcarbamoyladenylate synthase [Promethearchaeia archaeon]
MTARTLDLSDTEDIDSVVKEAASLLESGGLVVYPTDTSYGLACNPNNQSALERLIEVKRRDPDLGVPLLFSEYEQVKSYHDFGNLEHIIAKFFWPGALTLVVTAKKEIPEYVSGKRSTITVRVPNHPVPQGIAKEIGGPIVGTSANRSGGETPFEVSVAQEQLGDEVNLYIDGGKSEAEKSSTIVGVSGSDIKVYREGELSVERLSNSLKVNTDALRYWTARIIYPEM